ncbi:dynamin family protein [Campylobacter devanensis]|uniref:dynamin family protein n=1 Tax=Campylobacter devanensis TaxID=3161138 RepID=UPI000A3320F5|nr:dynamin family protein [Campylobacter sp. P0209]
MTKVNLSYNPFLSEVALEVNGAKANMPQVWGEKKIDELGNWASDFYDELERKYNDSEYEINFKGIMRDYEFLEDALKAHKNSSSFSLTGTENCVYAKDQLEKLKIIFAEIQATSPYEQLKNDEIKNHFLMATSNDFEIAVVATMSSGKSTLINAMLGRELLPARNEATTATIAKIYDEDGMTNFTAEVRSVGGKIIQTFDNFTLADMDAVNTAGNSDKYDGDPNDKPSTVEIHGDIVGIDSSNMRLVLSDTPGPNNSRTQEHKEHTYSLLLKEYKPMILYVLNATQIATNDDNALLKSVAEAMKAGGRQSNERFMFILNKADAFDPGKGEELENVIKTVKEYLAKHDIFEPRIFPVSAIMAKVIRQYINKDTLTETEEDEILPKHTSFIKREYKHFEKYASLSNYCKNLQDEMLEKAKDNPYKKALIHTGIVSIELAIAEYISKYALPKKVNEGVASFKEKLDNLGVEADEIDKLKGNQKAIEERIKNIEIIQKELANSDKAKKIKTQVEEISLQDRLRDELAVISSKFVGDLINELDKLIGNVTVEEANAKIEEFKKVLNDSSCELKAQISNLLETGIKKQADKYVEEYRKYVESLVGNVNFEMNVATAILGDLSDISTSDIISDYKTESFERVGSHIEEVSDSTWWNPFSWGDTKLIMVDDHDYVDRVNLEAIKEAEISPMIEKFVDNNRKAVLEEALEQENKLKEFFLEEFDKLERKIKEKIKEQEEIVRDKEKLEAKLAENEKNLAWIRDIKTKLDNLLSI